MDALLECLSAAVGCLADEDAAPAPSIVVHATTMSALALNELGAMEHARMLAQRTLTMTRAQFHSDLLPTALSCAARIESCHGQFARAECLHSEALERARWSSTDGAVHLVLESAMMSCVDQLTDESQRGVGNFNEQLKRRSRSHIVRAQRLDCRNLPLWQRVRFQQTLAELMGLSGGGIDSERLLRDCLAQSIAAGHAFSEQSSATALAAQLEAKGAFREALSVLDAHAKAENPDRGSFRRRLQANWIARSCLRKLEIGEEMADFSARIEVDLERWFALRARAIRMLLDAGIIPAASRWHHRSDREQGFQRPLSDLHLGRES